MSLQLDHWPRRRRAPTAYAMLRKRYSRQALQLMGFQLDSQFRFVKLGACRTLLAEAREKATQNIPESCTRNSRLGIVNSTVW